jgi:hypothetical protein
MGVDMDTAEDVFCGWFYRWWTDQTYLQKMTLEKAQKITADCRMFLKPRLVPGKMTQDAFNEQMETAQKVILFSVGWEDAKMKSIADFLKDHKIPKE